MAFTRETKPSTSFTRETKPDFTTLTWGEASGTWGQQGTRTWAEPKKMQKETKPTTSYTKETKPT